MLKKTILFVSLGSCIGTGSVQSYGHPDALTGSSVWHAMQTNKFAALVAAVAVAGTGYYWMNREANPVKIKRVEAVHQHYQHTMRTVLLEIESIQNLELFEARRAEFMRSIDGFEAMINDSYAEMDDFYNGWFTPWNYTSYMQAAYRKIAALRTAWQTDLTLVHAKMKDMQERREALEIIAFATPILSSWSPFVNEVDMIKFARRICQGTAAYPIHATVKRFQQYLIILYRTQKYTQCAQSLIDNMQQVCTDMLCSAVYVEETKAIKEEERAAQQLAIQERLAQAEEDKARAEREKASAQQQQAWAQQQQAWALQQQAEAQREHNRIEQNKKDKK